MEREPREALAALFYEARKALDLDQKAAGRRIRIDQPRWSRYEGGVLPPARVVSRFAKAFGKPEAIAMWREAKKRAAEVEAEAALGGRP